MLKLRLMLLLACIPASLAAQAVVTGLSPARNHHDAPLDANAVATCSAPMAQPGAGQFRLYSRQRGWLSGAVVVSGNDISFDPALDFLAGEEVEVVATGQLQPAAGGNLAAQVWRFRAGTPASAPMFNTNTYQFQNMANADEWSVACADFNGDTLPDIAVGRHNGQSSVYFNAGDGTWATSVNLGGAVEYCYDLAIGDFDEDGDMDIAKTNYAQQNCVWLNDGSGNFASSSPFGTVDSTTYCLAVGDLNGDGHLDIVCGNGTTSGVPNTIHLGDGTGAFPVTKTIAVIAGYSGDVSDCTFDIELADMDNDGSLDIITAEFSVGGSMPSRVYYNDGDANFAQQIWTGTALIPGCSDLGSAMQVMSLAVGDLDNDGDNDVILGTNGNPGTQTPTVNDLTYVIFNQGNRTYNIEWMSFQDEKTWGMRLADFNGDGSLDVIMCNEGGYRSVRLNDSTGHFPDYTGWVPMPPNAPVWLYLGGSPWFPKCDVADMDGDGDLDVVSPRWIYHNGPKAPELFMQWGGFWLNNGDTVQVPYNTTLGSLAPHLLVTDNQSYPVDISTTISSASSQGLNLAEWSITGAPTPCNLYPVGGVFNVGSVTHTFTIHADSGAATRDFVFHVQVSAAPAPLLAVSEGGSALAHNAPASGGRDFGARDVASGASAPVTITVANQGVVDLVIGSVSIAGADAQDFVLDLSGFNTTIAPSAFSTFSVCFDPLTPGAKSAQLQLVHNDPAAASPFSFEIAGLGTAYAAIVVSEGGSNLSPGAQLAFGSVPMNSPSAVRTITVQNLGTGVLTLGLPALAGSGAAQFYLDTSGLSLSVAPGASTSFSISLNPTLVGNHQALVTFSHDDGSVASPFTINLSGSATDSAGSGDTGGSGSDSGGGCAGTGGRGGQLILLLLLLATALAARRLAGRRA
ncbi:MAG: VCBS repeat-containing protein [Planctomycetes bacterium]|nr:VCBS repeat-containing protein [Planctomycetota bacterium]